MRSEGQSVLPPGHSGLLFAGGGGVGGGWRPFKLLFLDLLALTGFGDGSVGGWGEAGSSDTSPSPAPLGWD